MLQVCHEWWLRGIIFIWVYTLFFRKTLLVKPLTKMSSGDYEGNNMWFRITYWFAVTHPPWFSREIFQHSWNTVWPWCDLNKEPNLESDRLVLWWHFRGMPYKCYTHQPTDWILVLWHWGHCQHGRPQPLGYHTIKVITHFQIVGGGWPWRDLNTQPSDLESDALPLRHKVWFFVY